MMSETIYRENNWISCLYTMCRGKLWIEGTVSKVNMMCFVPAATADFPPI